MRNSIVPLAAAIAVSISLLSASFPAHAEGEHGNGHGMHKIGESGKVENVTKTISVEMFDNYFEPEALDLKEGETVRFVVTNKGEFVHEFNIGTAAMHADHQKEMMMMMEHGALEVDKINMDMMEMDMGNGETMKHNDPNSVLLEPGDSAEVIWTFPKDAELEFACNVPGHYESGMVGKVRLQ